MNDIFAATRTAIQAAGMRLQLLRAGVWTVTGADGTRWNVYSQDVECCVAISDTLGQTVEFTNLPPAAAAAAIRAIIG